MPQNLVQQFSAVVCYHVDLLAIHIYYMEKHV